MYNLYKKDSNGNIRVWAMEIDGDAYRTHSGVLDGKTVISGWKKAFGKNTRKANETTPEEQARAEVLSLYEKKENQGKYHKTISEASSEDVVSELYFSPMLAKKYETVVFPVFSQPKLDGVRCIATKDGLFTRNGKPLIATPHILDALQPIFDEYPYVTLDGELYNHNLKNDFDKIISLCRKSKPSDLDIEESAKLVEYHIYDVFLKGETFADRFFKSDSVATEIMNSDLESIVVVDTVRVHYENQLDELYGQYLEDGYEGQMIRNDLPYEQKRSKNLLKRKEFLDDEFEIVAVEEGQGNWSGYAKSIRIRLEDGTEQSAGIRGNQETARQYLEEQSEYVGGVATVRYQNRTPDNKLRFPVVVAMFKGKRDI